MTSATPLPWSLLSVVFLIQISEALNGCVLFPFIVFMLRDAGISERNLGWWSGLIGASFFLGQVVSSYHWGVLADRVGCKRCIVFGGFASGVSSLAFGFAGSAPMAMAVRFVCGLLNGTIGVMKSYLTQITDDSNRPTAFAMMPLGFGLGLVAASFMGGALSRPADSWPGVFDASFWRRYPYALPLLVCGGYQFITALASLVLLVDVRANAAGGAYAVVGDDGDEKDAVGDKDAAPAVAPAPAVPVWRRRGPLLSCMAYALMAGAQILYDELFPLFARGCLGWTSPKIGTFLACGGSAVLSGAFAAPFLLRRCGSRKRFAFAVSNLLNLPLGLLLPVLATWPLLFVAFFATRVAQTVGFTAVMLMVNSSTPLSEFGAVNGLGQSLAALMRAAGPLVGGTLWSGALGLARVHSPETSCPLAYTYLPYGSRAALVLLALGACAGIPSPPQQAKPPAEEEEQKEEADDADPDADAPFAPSEAHVEMV